MTKTFAYTLYHDEPEDAATDSTGEHGFPSPLTALKAARKAEGGYWNGGITIERGEFTPGEFGVRPDSWEWKETLDYYGPGDADAR